MPNHKSTLPISLIFWIRSHLTASVFHNDLTSFDGQMAQTTNATDKPTRASFGAKNCGIKIKNKNLTHVVPTPIREITARRLQVMFGVSAGGSHIRLPRTINNNNWRFDFLQSARPYTRYVQKSDTQSFSAFLLPKI